MSSPQMLAALFLDPRYLIVLKSDERSKAMFHLCKLWNQLLRVQCECSTGNTKEADITDNDEVDEYLESFEPSAMSSTESDIPAIWNRFDGVARLDSKANICNYWEENRLLRPQLYELATIIFAVPSSQTSVDRGFSHLSFIYNRYRTAVHDNMLNDIMFVRLNRDLFYQINNVQYNKTEKRRLICHIRVCRCIIFSCWSIKKRSAADLQYQGLD